jgi:hypothetical protein
MLSNLTTIHRPDFVYQTGGQPLLVTCDDFQSWVCKHSRDSSKLVNELLGSYFASLWNLRTPEISLISVPQEHIPPGLPEINFNKPCFGSRYIKTSKEIDDSTLCLFQDKAFRKKIKNKTDFLMIALFDVWLSNEDRNHNNSNLLIDLTSNNETFFTVFDHDAIFNTNALHRGIYQINDFDSIIYTKLANLLFKKDQRLVKIVDNLINNFYLCVARCEHNLHDIVALIPPEWAVDKVQLEQLLRDNLFSEAWLHECENNFRTLIQANIN